MKSFTSQECLLLLIFIIIIIIIIKIDYTRVVNVLGLNRTRGVLKLLKSECENIFSFDWKESKDSEVVMSFARSFQMSGAASTDLVPVSPSRITRNTLIIDIDDFESTMLFGC